MITMLPGDEAFPLTTNIMITERICNNRKQKCNRQNIQDILYVLLFIIFITKGQMLP